MAKPVSKANRVDEVYNQYVLDRDKHESALWVEALKHLQWVVGFAEKRREDIVQEALIYASCRLGSYDPARSRFGHWLRIICRSVQNRAWQKLTIERKRMEQPARLSEDDFFGDIDAMRQDSEDDGEDPDLNATVARERVRDLFNESGCRSGRGKVHNQRGKTSRKITRCGSLGHQEGAGAIL